MSLTADLLEKIVITVDVIVAVIAIAMIVLLVINWNNQKQVTKKRNVFRGVISFVLMGVVVAGNIASNIYASSLDSVFTKPAQPDSTITSTEDEWRGLATEIADEGMVLLKNENNTLPLEPGSKVNLLGYNAWNPLYSGSGSGSVSATDAVSIEDALTAAGFEVNPALAVDKSFWPEKPADTNPYGYNEGDLFLGDVDISNYSGELSFEEQAKYSDVGVVVIGRSGGEGFDLTALEDADYLELTDNEKDLLSASIESFDKVVVVLNMANALQMDELSKYDVDAIIWAGLPGPYGFTSLGSILNGSVNPSGSLPDTWVYDNDSNPANENYGDQLASNGTSHYVDYVEGIYVGYKWYETAYAERAVITNTKTGETFDYNDYESIVAYPFGYGLSYTNFSQELLAAPTTVDPNGTLTFQVKVTNTGAVAGKDAVQIYLSSPYTEYDMANGVEKAAMSLCAIAKTEEIAPGESTNITLTVNAEDIASYNSNYKNADGTIGAYMLDAGDYNFILGDNAHVAYDSIVATLDTDYFYSGENKRVSDDVQATNQFDDAARGEYLSRQNSFENYATAMASVTDVLTSTEWEDNGSEFYSEYDTEITDEYVEGVDYASGGNLTLNDMAGLDFEDEKWDELISQLTIEEMENLVAIATYQSPAIESIDKGATSDSDGPLGISSMFNSDLNSVAYPCIPILSATFNVSLAQKFGELVSDQAHNKGVTGWYAPAMDTHRSAYSGRNFEYYSEDAWLGAAMGSACVSGARDRGMTVYIKHFALNDQDTNRDKMLHTYSNEQAIREIYLKPFEYSVKVGGANAIMTSMNYIGDVFAGGHLNLQQNVLRGEWGFRGKSLTDMDTVGEGFKVDACMRAGTDSWLTVIGITFDEDVTNADIYYLQRAAKDILYAEANSKTYESVIANWQAYFMVLYIGLVAIVAVLIIKIFRSSTKKAEVILDEEK
ncbi:MAG: hypothetical protein E7273_11600 [Pseudobutyrivibrio ruminis]|nr:hypothetical protein [Pseudobutyrivibrio ruminis]